MSAGAIGSGASRAPTCLPGVLIVEDDPDLARLIDLLLDSSRYRVETTYELAGARAAIAAAPPPALVILDLILPDGYGLELLDALNRLRPPPTVLVLTGYVGARDAALGAGADVFMTKPFDPDVLESEVDRLLARR